MNGITEQDIQDFLSKTEEFLQDLPLPEREAAIVEWRQTLRSYSQAHPQADFTRMKMSFGGARGAANLVRLKLGRPLTYGTAPSVKRVILLTMLGGALLFSILLAVLWYKFTPFITINEDRVQVLGGLIDIDGQLGQVKVGDNYEFSESQFKNVFEGTFEVPPDSAEDVLIEFDRGQLEVSYTPDSRIVWDCKVSDEPGEGFIRQEKELIIVSLKSVGGTACAVKVPTRLKYTINGDAGKVDLIAPANDTFVQLGNGLVTIAPDSELSYRFDLKVGQGLVDPSFSSISSEDGIEIKVDLGNGTVEKK